MSAGEQGYLATAKLKPRRTEGIVHLLTPFIGTGLIALVVTGKPIDTRKP